MSSPAYLQLSKNNIYYFRRVVPLKLRELIGKREIYKSLRTRDPKKATILARVYALQYEEEFMKLSDDMSILDFIHEMREHGCNTEYLDQLIFTEYARELDTVDGAIVETYIHKLTEARTSQLIAHVREQTDNYTANVLEQVIDKARTLDTQDEQQIERIASEIILSQEASATPEPKEQKASTEKRRDDEYSDITLYELVETHKQQRLRDKNRGKAPNKHWQIPTKHQTAYRRLIEIVGSETFISEVNKNEAENVVDQIALLPSNTAKYRGKEVGYILENCSEGDQRFSPKNVNDYIDMYINLFEYGIDNDNYKWKNPFSSPNLKFMDGKKSKKRDPFEKSDLSKIFEGSWFTNYSVKGVGLKHGYKPHQYWAPLIALYTGARNNEIASLYLKDIKKSDELTSDGKEIWYFDINENDVDKKIKTDNACRRTPIHPKLIQLGLLEYKKALEDKGEEKLFGYLPYDSRNGYGRLIGEHFNDYLKTIGVYQNYKKVFYSFRHTVNSELTRAKVQPIHREAICGRSTGQTTLGDNNYTSDTTLRPVDLYDDLLKLEFDDVLQKVKPFFEMDIGG